MMKNITDISQEFGNLYHPKSALVFYQTEGTRPDTYVEYFDMDSSGMPVNAHPLTVREATNLVKALKTTTEETDPCLRPQGLIGDHILYLNPIKGVAMWFTKATERTLHFTESLGIPSGKAQLPPLLWMASRDSVYVFALGSNRRPNQKTKLYHAPFFNVYQRGNVCMGTVDVQLRKTTSLEQFTSKWEDYFFNSYFSHLVNGHNPINGNIVSLWKDLVRTDKPFPKTALKLTNKTIKTLMP